MKLTAIFSAIFGLVSAIPNPSPTPTQVDMTKRNENNEGGRYRTKPRTKWYVGCTASDKCYFTYDAVSTDAVPTPRVDAMNLPGAPAIELPAEASP